MSNVQTVQVADDRKKYRPKMKVHNSIEALTVVEEDDEEHYHEVQEERDDKWQPVRTKRRVRKVECGEIWKVDEYGETMTSSGW